MTAKHTLGPWIVRDDRTMLQQSAAQQAIPVFAYSRQHDCETAQFEIRSFKPMEEQLANARLIAAAPELLAALESAAKRLHQETDGDAWTIYQQAIAAIAKARGEG